MFQSVRFRLLISYLLSIEAVLLCFGGGVYFLFSRHLSSRLDHELMDLADRVTPTFNKIRYQNTSSLEQLSNKNIFDPQTQSIEWFDNNKSRLWHHGEIRVTSEPQPGLLTLNSVEENASGIRTLTFSLSVNSSDINKPPIRGYIRVSQSLEELEASKNQLLLMLLMTGIIPFTLAIIAGWLLTEEAVKPIEAGFKQQQQFTADASHELRGPLTAIKASIDLMRRHPERFQDKDIRKIGAIANATEQMTRLVEDLLFLARTEKKTITSNPEHIPISLNYLLQNLVELVQPLAQEKKITLDYQEFAQVSVMGNQDQLTRLFSNLLYNALNYTSEQGFVIVRLARHNRGVKISIEDTGIGISPKDLPHVFDRFWRADKARHKSGGTGLGLSIAQAIAHSHHGKITVESQLGIGTCFEVCVPIIENKKLWNQSQVSLQS
ncbi:MAG: HAMP domain-containing sensor histidine kinase [Crocosphaera sp.]